jgi:hypothetical protein
MNTRFACEYIVFATAQLLSNWCEQRPSSKIYVDSCITGEIESLTYGSGPASDFFFYLSTSLLLD